MKEDIFTIKKDTAKSIILDAQGLISSTSRVEDVFQKLSYVQIDIISVAERAHHHILFTRNKHYKQKQLDDLMADKSIFEYWSHAASFLPMEDYRFSLYPKSQILKGNKFWFEKDKKMMRYVMNRIKEEGPLQSKDFQDLGNVGSDWYTWKPAKIALTQLFMEGKLMVARRQGFQKVFDLTERVLPESVNTKKPTQTEFCKYLIERAITAQGIVSANEIGYLRKGLKKAISIVLEKMCREGEIIKFSVEGLSETYFSKTEIIEKSSSIRTGEGLHLLSPFDNLIIQRNRTNQFFEFDYQVECYVPVAKRKYGYFTLPILYGNRFIGRLDPKADRKTGIFHIKNLWFESGFLPDTKFTMTFAKEVTRFATFCGCHAVEMEQVVPQKYKNMIDEEMKA